MKKSNTQIRKYLAITVAIIIFAFIADSALADVLITEVLYDPLTSESDTEFVELYNTGDSAIDISGWKLNTTSVQATIPDSTTIAPGSYYLIADIDGSAAWPADWPLPDLGDEITLTNSDSGVRLQDSLGNLVDAVGWGNPAEGLYLGTPAPHVPEGESLARKKESSAFIQTSNNLNDFLAALPTPQNSESGTQSSTEILVQASVEGNYPAIDLFSVPYDDLPDEGIQILPIAGKQRNLTISAVISDVDGAEDIQTVVLTGKGQAIQLDWLSDLNLTSSEYEAVLNFAFYDEPDLYNLTLTATDSSGLSTSMNMGLEYQGIVAFEVDTESISLQGSSGQNADSIGDLDILTQGSPTIRNLGNTPLDFRLSASDLSFGGSAIPASSLLYSFLDSDFSNPLSGPLSQAPVLAAVNLLPGSLSLRELSIRLMIPIGTMAGSYQGSLYISGVES